MTMPSFVRSDLLITVLLAAGIVCSVPTRQESGGGQTEPRDSSAGDRSVSVAVLEPFNGLVGQWRGVGQLRRGSRKGAWIESMECRWEFMDERAAVVFACERNPHFETLRFHWDPEREQLVAALSRTGDAADGAVELFGGWEAGQPDELTAESVFREDVGQSRLRLKRLSDIRCTVLLEQRATTGGSYRRAFEIGYTRKGESLAVAGTSGPECVVTGGRGTIRVSHGGRDYYVCCTGCRQVFDADPEGTIAAYRERQKTAAGRE